MRVLDRVVAPPTPRVLVKVVAPVTPSVPVAAVLPVWASTVNSDDPTLKSSVALTVPAMVTLPSARVIKSVSAAIPSFLPVNRMSSICT